MKTKNKTAENKRATGAARMDEIDLVGISARTKNSEEINGSGKIPQLWQRFFAEGVLDQIQNKKIPGEITVAYTDFETDDSGLYTIIIGARVNSSSKNKIKSLPDGFTHKKIQAASYTKIATERGSLQKIGVNAWMKIWSDSELRKKRAFIADLEIYGEDARDPENATFEIYLGMKE